jgi:drug/metabolite transporter (DMT)-like permease
VRRHDRLDAKAMMILVVLCALWGFQQVCVKVALAGGVPPITQAFVRSGGAALLLFAYVWLREGTRAARRLFVVDAAFGAGAVVAVLFAVEFLLLFPGLKLTTASRGVVFLYTAPFFTALGTHFFIPAERLQTRQAIGLVVAFGGVAIAFADGFFGGGGSLAGDALCAASALAWGATTVVVKASPALLNAGANRVLLFQLGGSAPLLLIGAIASGELNGWPQVTVLAGAALAYQTVVVAFASYLVWFWLVLAYPANRLSGFTFLTPVFGILCGALLLGEPVGFPILVGLVAIAAGLRLLNGAPRVVTTSQRSGRD